MPELYIGHIPEEQPPCLTKRITAAAEAEGEARSIAGNFVPLVGAQVLRGYCLQAALNQCKVSFTIPYEGQLPETVDLNHADYLQMLAECPARTVDPV